jgi:hypothetical protein
MTATNRKDAALLKRPRIGIRPPENIGSVWKLADKYDSEHHLSRTVNLKLSVHITQRMNKIIHRHPQAGGARAA